MIMHTTNDDDKCKIWENFLGCQSGKIPFSYLGAWIVKLPSVNSFMDQQVSRMKEKLAQWKRASLNSAGRLVLLKASIDGIPSYWMNLHHIPSLICDKLERFMRQFFCGEFNSVTRTDIKLHLTKWKAISLQKESGGLGVQLSNEKNLAFLGKWWWRFMSESHKKWNVLMYHKYQTFFKKK